LGAALRRQATTRKLLATVAVICGLGLVAAPFALSLFDRAPAGERITDRFRQTLSTNGLHDLAANFGTMGALVDTFDNRAAPALAAQLRMTPAEFQAYVADNFPAVAAGVKGIPPLVAFVTPVAAQLEALHPQFAAVDSLPFLGLPLTTVPWILVLLGGGLVALGAIVLAVPGRVGVLVAGAVGLAMIVVPLALSYPQKATDAGKVAAVGRVALSAKAAAGAQQANRLIDGLVTQAQTQMLPAVAARLHETPAALEGTIAADFPAVTRGLAAWARIKPGAFDLVRRQVASVHDAAELNGLDFAPLPWLIIGPGIALLLLGGAAVIVGRRGAPAPSRRRRAASTPVGGVV
jgi:hypothetical protein